MGTLIQIGNAIPFASKEDFPILEACWMIEDKPNNLKIPVFGLYKDDTLWITYSNLLDFLKDTGLIYSFLVEQRQCGDFTNIGCQGITESDLNQLRITFEKYKEEKCEWNENYMNIFDWLQYWIDWAIKNCETPAICIE